MPGDQRSPTRIAPRWIGTLALAALLCLAGCVAGGREGASPSTGGGFGDITREELDRDAFGNAYRAIERLRRTWLRRRGRPNRIQPGQSACGLPQRGPHGVQGAKWHQRRSHRTDLAALTHRRHDALRHQSHSGRHHDRDPARTSRLESSAQLAAGPSGLRLLRTIGGRSEAGPQLLFPRRAPQPDETPQPAQRPAKGRSTPSAAAASEKSPASNWPPNPQYSPVCAYRKNCCARRAGESTAKDSHARAAPEAASTVRKPVL